jgi:hypothetical protein
MADVDWGQVEQQLKQRAGQWYDPSMLQDVQRNVSYGAGNVVDPNSVNDWINRIAAKATLRGGNESNSTYTANGQGGYTTGSTGKVNTPTYQPSTQPTNAAPQQQASGIDWAKVLYEQNAAQQAQNTARANGLWEQLSARANQSLAIDRNNPIIRAQADAYSANTERARRNYISDAAERGGQFANLDTERRMAAEHAGQANAGFEAQLLGRELQSRRDEIAQALAQLTGIISADKENALRQQLAGLDAQLKQQGLAVTAAGQNQSYDTALRRLGLDEWSQNQLWDYNRTFGGL